jgi:hypothetical protein
MKKRKKIWKNFSRRHKGRKGTEREERGIGFWVLGMGSIDTAEK